MLFLYSSKHSAFPIRPVTFCPPPFKVWGSPNCDNFMKKTKTNPNSYLDRCQGSRTVRSQRVQGIHQTVGSRIHDYVGSHGTLGTHSSHCDRAQSPGSVLQQGLHMPRETQEQNSFWKVMYNVVGK